MENSAVNKNSEMNEEMLTEILRGQLGVLSMDPEFREEFELPDNYPDTLNVPRPPPNTSNHPETIPVQSIAKSKHISKSKMMEGELYKYKDIVQKQIALQEKDEDNERVKVAADEATKLAEQLKAAVDEAMELGKKLKVTKGMEAIKTHDARLTNEFHASRARLGLAWINFTKMARIHEHRSTKLYMSISDLKDFKKDEATHEQGIENANKRLQELSGPLLALQREHVYQFKEKSTEQAAQSAPKVNAAKLVSTSPEAQEILLATTAYSGIRKGHEEHGPLIAAKTQEYMDAAKTYYDLLTMGKQLQETLEKRTEERAKVVQDLESAGKKHHEAAIINKACFEALCAFVRVLGGEEAVGKVKVVLHRIAQLYDQNPGKGYEWAWKQGLAGREAVVEVEKEEDDKGKGKEVEEAMEAVDLGVREEGEGKGEEVAEEEKKPAKAGKKKGKGKGKKGGKGKGKK